MMIKRLYRQHSTTVLTIPKPMLLGMGIKAGDYVEIELVHGNQVIRITKVIGRAENERTDENNQSEQHSGG